MPMILKMKIWFYDDLPTVDHIDNTMCTRFQQVRAEVEARNMAQLEKCLFCKVEDLSLFSKNPSKNCMHLQPERGKWEYFGAY